PLARVLLLTTMEVRSMPEKETLERAQEDAAEGKSPSTQAGEFVREEMHHIREGKHGARTTKQAIAIGLSKARRAGVELNPPSGPPDTRKKAASDVRAGKSHRKPSAPRARAVRKALRREGGDKKARDHHAQHAADHRQHHRLGRELRADVAPPRAEGAPQADLADVLVHGDEHDVHDPDPADAKRERAYEHQQDLQADR